MVVLQVDLIDHLIDHLVVLLVVLLVPISMPLIRKVIGGAKGRDLIEVLGGTGRLQLAFAVTTAVALIL